MALILNEQTTNVLYNIYNVSRLWSMQLLSYEMMVLVPILDSNLHVRKTKYMKKDKENTKQKEVCQAWHRCQPYLALF